LGEPVYFYLRNSNGHYFVLLNSYGANLQFNATINLCRIDTCVKMFFPFAVKEFIVSLVESV